MKKIKFTTEEMVKDIRHVMEMYPEEEMEEIVRAVNHHEELIATLKWFQTRVTPEMSGTEIVKVAYGFIDVAAATIKKVEGK